MIKYASIGFTILCFASTASAQWEAQAGYSRLDNGPSFDFGAVVLGAGYNFPVNDRLIVVPTVRAVTGQRRMQCLCTMELMRSPSLRF